MGLLISNIAKIGKGVLPKNLFMLDLGYYLYILDYANFDFQEMDSYSSAFHSSGMSRILNNYHYGFSNSNVEKLESHTFHSSTIMSWQKIFDIENANYDETKPARVTPAFLFTTVSPNNLNNLSIDDVPSNEFIFLRIKLQDRDANRVPQLVNDMFSNIGLTVSKCKRSEISSKYKNVHVFDYCPETQITKVQYVKNEINVGGDFQMNGSTIGPGNNVSSTKQEIKQDGGFWKGVWQNVVSNFIWWLLGAIALAALIYLEVK